MGINATFIGQTIAFIIFVWLCYKFIWPPLIKAIEERQESIADALEKAEKAKSELSSNRELARDEIERAKAKSKEIIEEANKRSLVIVETARKESEMHKNHMIEIAMKEIEVAKLKMRQELRGELASVSILAAEKVLHREITAADNAKIIDKIIDEIK